MLENEVLILMDFAMNYSCLLQDVVQNYHWSKKMVTVHPVEIYYRQSGELKHQSICFISDDTDHDDSLVQEFQEQTLNYIKANLPQITEVIYVTDGCAKQYKNYKSFIFLCRHEETYGLKATWFFYATSHGKSTCDGISGLVKREAVRASLQRPKNNQIVDAFRLFEFCCSSRLSNNIKFFLVEKSKVDVRRELQDYGVAIAIPGTRSFHHFFPLSESSVGCKRVSSDTNFELIHQISEPKQIQTWRDANYVAVMVHTKLYIALVTDVDEEEQEADLALLYPPLPATVFSFHEDGATYVAPFPHLLTTVPIVEAEGNPAHPVTGTPSKDIFDIFKALPKFKLV